MDYKNSFVLYESVYAQYDRLLRRGKTTAAQDYIRINQNNVLFASHILRIDIVVQVSVFKQVVKLRQVEVDLNDVVVGYILFNMIFKRFKQLGFSATMNTRDDLNIRSTDYIDELF